MDSNRLTCRLSYALWWISHAFLYGFWCISYRLPLGFQCIPYSPYKVYKEPLTNHHMDSNGFPIHFCMDSGKFPIDFHKDYNKFPAVFVKFIMDH